MISTGLMVRVVKLKDVVIHTFTLYTSWIPAALAHTIYCNNHISAQGIMAYK
jgi:hypothetical protein